jgi:uncharacterized protein YciI
MRFIVIARDGTDEGALARRHAARDAHLALGDEGIARGEFLMAMALLNDDGQMVGSTMLVDFPDRAALDKWLEIEPYVTGGVWVDVEVQRVAVGPSFEKFLSS